jgi:TPR repeat protein
VPSDFPRAISIYRELADDRGLAQFHSARICHNGIGIAIDIEEAKRFYLRASDSNIGEAKQNYVVLLVTRFHEWNLAAHYFEMAIAGEGAQDSARHSFAQLLLQGMRVSRDVAPERLFREAALAFVPAMVCYAQILERKGDRGAID